MATSSLSLPFEQEPESLEERIAARDRAGRARAVDPRFNVALEASAGTGKTRVLVDRYINLLRAGVDPANILAITFTRKAAAEMRERILSTLRAAAERGEIAAPRWRELRDRTNDISISTIDAFCLSLLREFPLEADLDPGFSMADETEVPRLVDESLDRALRVCRSVAEEDEHVALVFAQLGDRRARAGLAALLNRRIVAPEMLSRFLTRGPRDLTLARAAGTAAASLLGRFEAMRGGLEAFLECGPPEPGFLLLTRYLRRLEAAVHGGGELDPAALQAIVARVREHFLTQDGQPRSRLSYTKTMFATAAEWQRHRDLVVSNARGIAEVLAGYRRDLNVLVSRGVWRMFKIAETEYRRTLDAHAVLDFSDVLLHAVALLRQMEEFAQSRYRLESRYHHVLVDEFQDTSRAQWELVSLLVQAWGEGAGLAYTGPLQPSIFIVGDRKQSIYGFRDADAAVLHQAARHLEGLRPGGDVRRSISRSFRSSPALLAFVNDVCHDIEKAPSRADAFTYTEHDRFPLDSGDLRSEDAVGVITGDSAEACAGAAAAEIARLLHAGVTVRDRDTGVARPVRAGDVAVLFRTRESHREFEEALEQRGIPAYVYKGLGFFDSDEIKDVLALLWYLAEPHSDLRAAAWLRSRFLGLSDDGLRLLAPRLAEALTAGSLPAAAARLDAADARVLAAAREGSAMWRPLVDRIPAGELLDRVIAESAYALEMGGPRLAQARENLKKMRGLVRRIQNRGYATLARIVTHLDRLAVGDESNAVIDAANAVNLMTVHAAKGLEFPVVFVVNLARGTGNRRDPIRVAADPEGDGGSVSVGDFLSEADDQDVAKEREETKRLLYVALTRARDRLYLASVLKDGRLQPGRGSLAEVLPATLVEQFVPASAASAEWHASSGTVHRLHAYGEVSAVAASGAQGTRVGSTTDAGREDFAPLVDDSPAPWAVATAIAHAGGVEALHDEGAGTSSRTLGTLVHRLARAVGLGGTIPDAVLRAQARSLLEPDELADVEDPETLLAEARHAYTRLCERPDVQALYASGTAFHEVPFTMSIEGRVVRGSIDCLVRTGDLHFTLLELKTGRPRPEHGAQTAMYSRAVDSIFPGATVEVLLVYLERAAA